MTARRFSIFLLGFFALWVLAWLKHNLLVGTFSWWSADNHAAELAYWATAKFLIWIIYPWWYWRRLIPNLRDVIGLSPTTLRAGYRWGMIAAGIWVVGSIGVMWLRHHSFVGVDRWSTLIYIVTLTPIAEEILFRGFMIAGLQALRVEGKITNLITTLLFLLVHVLGWSFQRALMTNLTSGVWLSIALVSLVAGFLRIHSRSLRAPIALHIVNNLLAQFGIG